MIILWGFILALMALGGYAVYYRVLGIGTSNQNSSTEATIASMLFVFGTYCLGLVLHAYLFGKSNPAYTETMPNLA